MYSGYEIFPENTQSVSDLFVSAAPAPKLTSKGK
jgi:hypothetical protein